MQDFRFTYTHEIEGAQVFDSPAGWDTASLGFTRQPFDQGASLVEYYKSSFGAYGSNGSENGGRDWLKMIEITYGPDAALLILVEMNIGGGYEKIFSGTVPVSLFVETLDQDLILEMTFAQSDFWTKFVNRVETPVDIQSTTDLDGNSVDVISHLSLNLPTQIIRVGFSGLLDKPFVFYSGDIPLNNYIQVDYDKATLDEIESRITIGSGSYVDIEDVKYEFPITDDGDYTFNLRFEASAADNILDASTGIDARTYNYSDTYLDFFVQVNSNAPVLFTVTNSSIILANRSTIYTFNQVLSLKRADTVRIYGKMKVALHTSDQTHYSHLVFYGEQLTGMFQEFAIVSFTPGHYEYSAFSNILISEAIPLPPSGVTPSTTADVLGKTTFPATTAPAFLIFDIAASILARLGSTTLKSQYLGGPLSSVPYASEGCGYPFVNVQGLQVRGYSLGAKPFFYAWKDFVTGIRPILNIGYGYTDDGQIEIKPLEEFFDASDMSVKLSWVDKISRSYDKDNQFNLVNIGYSTWNSDDTSGIDDPQTQRFYATVFKNIGQKIELFSSWIAASLTWERTRRTTITQSADYQYDNNVFVAAVTDDGSGGLKIQTDEGFSGVTGLNDDATRYNKRLTPARNLLRWLKYLSSCLQAYPTSVFKFTGGEGNYDMSAAFESSCDDSFGNEPLSEKQDIPVTTDTMFCTQLYEIEHYITWDQYKAIRANRDMAIGISQTDVDHKPFFIKDFDYTLAGSDDDNVKITAWPKEYFEIRIVETSPPSLPAPEGVFDITFARPPFA